MKVHAHRTGTDSVASRFASYALAVLASPRREKTAITERSV